MAALTADKKTQYRDGIEASLPVDGGSVIYAGALVSANASGYLIPGADTASTTFQGVAREHVDNTSGADGAVSCLVRRRGLFRVTSSSSLTQANAGNKVYLVDDQTVALAAVTTNDIFCGVIVEVISSTEAWIDIEPAVCQVS
jgi:hypothetical protein